jgi:hypothetical protein
MTVTVDLSGLKEFKKKLERVDKEFNTFLRNFLFEQAERALAMTKKNHPWITGHMRNSWFIGNIVRVGDNLEITIYNTVHYASYVEYGHIIRRKKGEDGWKEGSFKCTLAIAEVEREIPARWDRQFSAWIKSMGL